MKILKKFIGIFLSSLIIISNSSILNRVKAEGNYGYIHIRYVDMNKDINNPTQDIYERKTIPVLLDSTGKGFYKVDTPGVAGYNYQYAKADNKQITQLPPFNITVTASNTDDNAVNVLIYYKATSASFSVTTYGGIIHSDGTREIFYNNPQSAKGGQTVTTNAPGAPYETQKYLGYTFDKDESIRGTDSSVNVTVSNESKDVYYWYEEAKNVTGDITVTTGDHVLNVQDMKVVNEADGKDYFERKDTTYKSVNGSKTITVQSPSGGKSGYKLYYALVGASAGRGEPNEALNSYITPPGRVTSTSVTLTIKTSVTDHYYVHFYWVPENTPPPGPEEPDSDQIVFNPNETSWTFDSSKKPGWSNAGKTSNGSGDYKVNSKFIGDNPAMSKGVVTYTYQLQHTGTTGNPPHSYTYWTDESYSEEFDVSYYLKNMSISGDDSPNPTVFNFEDKGQGTSFPVVDANGDVHIKKEGANLGLSGTASWYDLVRNRDYSVPAFHASGTTRNVQEHLNLPQSPANPKGSSGTYKLDWTNPEINFSVQPGIFSTDRNAVRKASQKGEGDGFYGTLTFSDNLSGCKSLQYGWTFGNNPGRADYETIYSSDYTDNDRSSETLTKEIEKPVGDDLYLHVKLIDMAGNETDKTFGPFEDPIKLKNFRVTDVNDPTWDNIFWKDSSDKIRNQDELPGLSQPRNREFKANELPLDSDSNPHKTFIKKGYMFYYKVDSEYLYRNYDRIEIEPTFYYWDGTKRVQVDAYYNKDNNPFTKVGSPQDTFTVKTYPTALEKHGNVEIGGYNKITLTKEVRDFKGRPFYNGWKDEIQYTDGKEQTWGGVYYLPDTTIFAEKGKSPRPENVLRKNYIIINFQLKAYKNGAETNSSNQVFTYVPNQWSAENGPKSAKYKSGDVIVYDNKYSVFSNFRSVITN
ncbi:MAG: hypothetical protein LKF87_12265 [Clostridium tyrobutyricum]|jgi:hypothetical protein|uniref:hypothetical protein n=1 Tax=Clostridium tyrobutyricum TaxID=1519 RepID=UPI00242A8803|nr:hypothetical protein [Clostridium tyrobutyricum]MCH4200564.1 hypothetical protein [Clostridium tyrobutyricum]MCH4237589.1 hypothetical protein [Clostridium tyrobutyricum]MCH4259700.1 hypothetical protein [Clostridium tyrobutyricum]